MKKFCLILAVALMFTAIFPLNINAAANSPGDDWVRVDVHTGNLEWAYAQMAKGNMTYYNGQYWIKRIIAEMQENIVYENDVSKDPNYNSNAWSDNVFENYQNAPPAVDATINTRPDDYFENYQNDFPDLDITIKSPKVGDKIGDVLNTDVKTYINGERIPCYNINGKAVIIVADLRNYGFDSVYNDNARTSTITRNYSKEFAPIQNISNNTAKAGTVAFPYLYTDISAVVNARKVESFNINGNIVIYFESLGNYGTFAWDSTTVSSKLTLYKTPAETATALNVKLKREEFEPTMKTHQDEWYNIEVLRAGWHVDIGGVDLKLGVDYSKEIYQESVKIGRAIHQVKGAIRFRNLLGKVVYDEKLDENFTHIKDKDYIEFNRNNLRMRYYFTDKGLVLFNVEDLLNLGILPENIVYE